MKKSYDFAVVGAGVFGAWSAHELRRKGAIVVLVEAYGQGNSRSSSGGETRIIRMGYGPDELYTRLAERSLKAWMEFQERARQRLFHRTGVLMVTDDSDAFIREQVQVFRKRGTAHEELTRAQIRRRWPALAFEQMTRGVFEPESGVLMARQAVAAVVREAVEEGVEFRVASAAGPSGGRRVAEIKTTSGAIAAGSFIFACGAWLPKVFPRLLRRRIFPTRQEIFFLGAPAGSQSFRVPNLPAWIQHTHHERPYSLPDVDGRGVKISFDRHGPAADPNEEERTIKPASIRKLRPYLKRNLPALAAAPILETRVCQYENTANGDFLIDRHPEFENVWIVGGGSGHGFKHGPAVGEYVSELVFGRGAAEPRFTLASKQSRRRRSVY